MRFRREFRRECTPTRFVVSLLLVVFVLFQRTQNKRLAAKVKEVSETLTIYRQMRDYSENVCKAKTDEDDMVVRGGPVDVDVERVKSQVTFIFISQPDFACANSKLKELRQNYPAVEVLVAFESWESETTELREREYPFLQQTVNLGGFKNYPEALQNAISAVNTKYFLVLDAQVAISELQPKFAEKLLGNIPGFDVLGGSEINRGQEFFIPCHSLRLQNWTFSEKFEYHTIGNAFQCESTSRYFLAKTENFKKVLEAKNFNTNLGPLWRQDYFIGAKEMLIIGTLPEVIFKITLSISCPRVNSSSIKMKRKIDSLLPFVNKYHVFDFINQNGNKTSICDGSDPLICSEKYVFPKWKLRHWAYSGLTAFPFIVQRLIDALHFGSDQLDQAGIKYVLEGGTLLGFVKIRAVLPWDSGDVDTFVFSNRRSIIKLVKKIKKDQGYEYKLRWNAFHVYVTPYYPTHDGLFVYAVVRQQPGELIKIRMHGKLFPASRKMFKFLREYYGSSYLESRIRFGDERVSCDYEGYHACMPDCRWDGCGSGPGRFPGILA